MQKPESLYYQAFVNRNPEFDGLVFVGVKTTGIFCRPTCPARKPKLENCLFFETSEMAKKADFRPCLRCHPEETNEDTPLLSRILEKLQGNPEHRWGKEDYRAIGADESTVRRLFGRRFDMTFVAYARSIRLYKAREAQTKGELVLSAQLEAGYASAGGYRKAFRELWGKNPKEWKQVNPLLANWIETPVGVMMAVANESALVLLEFMHWAGLAKHLKTLQKTYKTALVVGESPLFEQIKRELDAYFAGMLKKFTTPLLPTGTPFQQKIWDALLEIPYGETVSYAKLAESLGKPSAVRAVASANARNPLALVIPCHRVVGKNGAMRGYSGGEAQKEWLIRHEEKNK